MIEIIDEFITPLQLKEFLKESNSILSDQSSKFYFNHISWDREINDDRASGPVMTHPIGPDNAKIINEVCLERFGVVPHSIAHQYYFEGAYIPWHDDGSWDFAVTVFLQKWLRKYGGMFCYLEDSESETVVSPKIQPRRAIVQQRVWHHVTPVNRRSPVRQSLQLFFK